VVHAGKVGRWFLGGRRRTKFQFQQRPNGERCDLHTCLRSPGSIRVVDLLGGHVAGVVNVQALKAKTVEDQNRWYEMLAQPAPFEISGESLKPHSVNIIGGQTVFWSVQKTGGIGITERASGRRARLSRQPEGVCTRIQNCLGAPSH
jgi:hypothetical protein